ncbi:hypothetical protein [Brevundimonas variabilis]|uniref:Uncharacterized protein n=1 Tax=Brevundimonas variabilis TaxID=74312 RepID=A0A7W9CJB7_9CAUL|nr:hypothetical protein [Brevundimonas variabilis]MBB5746237.1 hypothetical protein [Brevundimonas variabilis]
MQALIELIAGFIALLAAVALAQFGMDMAKTAKPDREVRRLQDCGPAKVDPSSVTVASRRC